MKKFLGGCLLVLFLVCAAAAVSGYFFVWIPLKAVADKVQEYEKLDETIANHEPFTPPADGHLTTEQVSRFAAVMETVDERVDQRVDDLEELQQMGAMRNDASLREVIAGLRTAGSVITAAFDARFAEVEALNTQGFSLSEYQWVAVQFFRAAATTGDATKFNQVLGFAITGQIPQMPDIPGLPTSGSGAAAGTKPDANPANSAAAPSQSEGDAAAALFNAALLGPHRERAERWALYYAFTRAPRSQSSGGGFNFD